MSNWEMFALERFVGRQQERDQFKAWLRQNDAERLYSFVGAAGTGKTWLLQALEHDLAQPDLRAELFEPIFVSFPKIMADMANSLARYTTSVYRWVRAASEALEPRYAAFSPIADDMMAKQMVAIFVKILCEDFGLRPVLIVEGYDEIEHTFAVRLTNDVLYPFMGQAQSRIVMGRRDVTLRDVDMLRLSDKQVILKADAAGKDQFVRFLQCFDDTAHMPIEKLPDLQSLVPTYNWNHYFINGYLYSTALSRPGTPFEALITTADRENCCRDLILRGGRSFGSPANRTQLQLLKQIAQRLPRSWTEQGLQHTLNIGTMAIEQLFLYGAISRDPDRIQRFRIADGLYEILSALPSEEN